MKNNVNFIIFVTGTLYFEFFVRIFEIMKLAGLSHKFLMGTNIVVRKAILQAGFNNAH